MIRRLRTSPARTITWALLAAAVFLIECPRPKKSSPEFAKANELFTRLYGAKLDEAYADPQMNEVEQWLSQVPKESLDFPAAQALLKRIHDGRAKLSEDEAKVRSAVKQLTASGSYQRMDTRTTPAAKDAGSAEAPDAGPEVPKRGMARAEFMQKFSRCFTPSQPIVLFDQGVSMGKMDSWELKDIANCRDLYPDFVQSLVLTDEQKVVTTVAKNTVELRPVTDAAVLPPLGGDH